MEEILDRLRDPDISDEEQNSLIYRLRVLSIQEGRILTPDFFTSPDADRIYKTYLYEMMNYAIYTNNMELINRIRKVSGIPLKKHTVSLNKKDEESIWLDVLSNEYGYIYRIIKLNRDNINYTMNVVTYAIEEGIDVDGLFFGIVWLVELKDADLPLLQYTFDNYGDKIDIERYYERIFYSPIIIRFLDKMIESQV